jgi:hypothetical protein
MKTHKGSVFCEAGAGPCIGVAYTSTFYTIVSLLFYMGYFKKNKSFRLYGKGVGVYFKGGCFGGLVTEGFYCG